MLYCIANCFPAVVESIRARLRALRKKMALMAKRTSAPPAVLSPKLPPSHPRPASPAMAHSPSKWRKMSLLSVIANPCLIRYVNMFFKRQFWNLLCLQQSIQEPELVAFDHLLSGIAYPACGPHAINYLPPAFYQSLTPTLFITLHLNLDCLNLNDVLQPLPFSTCSITLDFAFFSIFTMIMQRAIVYYPFAGSQSWLRKLMKAAYSFFFFFPFFLSIIFIFIGSRVWSGLLRFGAWLRFLPIAFLVSCCCVSVFFFFSF